MTTSKKTALDLYKLQYEEIKPKKPLHLNRPRLLKAYFDYLVEVIEK